MIRPRRAPAPAWMLLMLAGCAPLPPPVAPAPPAASGPPPVEAPAARPTRVGITASGGAIISNAPHAAVVDSGPSAEAIAVLSGIPEPLPPAERVPPPGFKMGVEARVPGSEPGVAVPDSAVTESLRTVPDRMVMERADSASDIPVPAPTLPLGDRPGSLVAPGALDSASVAPPRAAPPPARPDSCWRVQIAAPDAREEAEAKRAAAQSLLLVPMVVETEKGRFKVRCRDCLSHAAAEGLRRRALASGFAGAFPMVEVKR